MKITLDQWCRMVSELKASKTYQKGFFVYAEWSFDGEKWEYGLCGENLTEAQAKEVLAANDTFNHDLNGYEYSYAAIYNLYDPHDDYTGKYERAAKKPAPQSAKDFHERCQEIRVIHRDGSVHPIY